MREKSIIHQETIAASKINEVGTIKEKLTELEIRKNSNGVFDLYNKFKDIANGILTNLDTRLNNDLMETLLLDALEHKNFDWAKYLVDSNELKIHSNVNGSEAWKSALITEDLGIIKYFITHKKFKSGAVGIVNALEFKNIKLSVDVVKYLLDDKSMLYYNDVQNLMKEKLKRKPNGFYSSPAVFNLFINACENENIELMDFLVKHDKFKMMIDQFNFEVGIGTACKRNSVEVMRYLLTNESMRYKCPRDIAPLSLYSLVNQHNAVDVAKYLVFDLKLPEQKNSPDVNTEIVDEMFAIRKIHEELQDGLSNKTESTKPKRKI